jgi:DNA repair protein RAD5
LFQGFIQAGTASKSWLAIFSLLHRLRQTCDHVALTVKAHLDDDEWASNIAKSQNDTKPKATPSASSSTNKKGSDAIDKKFLDDLMGKFRSMQASGSKTKGSSSEMKNSDAPYAASIAKMLNEAVQSKSSLLKEECSICLDPINIHDSVVTPCFHIFCKECLVGVLQQQKLKQQGASQEADSSKPSASMLRLPNGPCPVCNEAIQSSKILRLSESDGDIQTSYLLDSMEPKQPATIKEGDGVARQTLETAVRGSTSSKLTAILQELDNVWKEEPGSKVLIFSQFLGFLDLMEESFKTNQIPFSRLDGSLSLKERKTVLEEFGRSDKTNGGNQRVSAATATKKNAGSVLLISMKAGGVGLNLTAARTVFIADPWWNAAVEDQCVDRIHRIGQTADKVRVRKFYVNNSVEERIVELQKRKKNVASEVLCDDKGQEDTEGQEGAARPTLDDFKILFRGGADN